MSDVHKLERKESRMKYLDTAVQLYEHTAQYTRKQFSRKDWDYVVRLRDKADLILMKVCEANSIFPTTREDFDTRRKLLIEARGVCYALVSVLSSMQRLSKQVEKDSEQDKDSYKYTKKVNKPNILVNSVTDYGWDHWGDLCVDEIAAIDGILRSDKERSEKL